MGGNIDHPREIHESVHPHTYYPSHEGTGFYDHYKETLHCLRKWDLDALECLSIGHVFFL